MPSPFPGMDPYLEGEMWQEFHDRLINQISNQLLATMPKRYVALLAKRTVLSYESVAVMEMSRERVFYPDVHVLERSGKLAESVPVVAYPISTIVPVELTSPIPEEIPQLTVEIRDVAERRLVTIIEILSPANKVGDGARDYAERRLSILRTRTHLLEIDLLRQGHRIELIGQLPRASYYAFLSRVQDRPHTLVWPVQLADRLPSVPVPLLPPDPDATLDLQAAVDACFELVGYETLLDYTVPPPPPALDELEAAWVRERVAALAG